MDDIFSVDDVSSSMSPPRPHDQPPSEAEMQAMKEMYRRDYAPGLDRFLETSWFSTAGEALLLSSRETMDHFLYCVDQFRRQPSTQQEFALYASLEARLVWSLAVLPRTVVAEDAGDPRIPEVKGRLITVEHLIRGDFNTEHDLPPVPANVGAVSEDPRISTPEFWYHLAHFTSVRDDVSSAEPKSPLELVEADLSALRSQLCMQEQRDVLYSIAIARHYGGRMDPFYENKILVPSSDNPADPTNKLVVAQGFVAQEENAGTTQVVQRLCGMARRSWSKCYLGPRRDASKTEAVSADA